jgi:hypothetical protein
MFSFVRLKWTWTRITDREVAQHAGVSINRIRRGNYNNKLYAQIQEAIGIHDKPLYFLQRFANDHR